MSFIDSASLDGKPWTTPTFWRLWGLLTLKVNFFAMKHQKGTFLGGNASFVPSIMEIGLTCGGERENNMKVKERKAMHKKSQNCYMSRSFGGKTPGASSMKFGPLVDMINFINFAKFDHCNLNGLNLPRV
jgi:hypothetical protein